jgi:hypothetical protein
MRQRCVRPITRLGKRVSEPLLHRFWPLQANRGASAGTRVLFPGRHTTLLSLWLSRGVSKLEGPRWLDVEHKPHDKVLLGLSEDPIYRLPVRAVLLFSSPNPKAARPSQTTFQDCLCAIEFFGLGAIGYLSILYQLGMTIHAVPLKPA